MRVLLAVLSWLLIAWPAHAQIYRCESANGVVEYSNSPGSGKDRNCRAVDLPAVTSIPAPKLPPGRGSGAGNNAGNGGGASARNSPENFPRVDGAAQKSRDTDRKRIIEDELRKEEVRLLDLKKEYNNGEPERQGDERNYQKYLDRVQRLKDDIGRSEGNITSLRRELAAVRE